MSLSEPNYKISLSSRVENFSSFTQGPGTFPRGAAGEQLRSIRKFF